MDDRDDGAPMWQVECCGGLVWLSISASGPQLIALLHDSHGVACLEADIRTVEELQTSREKHF
jgi:hypothetical protein